MAVLSSDMRVFELSPFQALVQPGAVDQGGLARRFVTLVTDPYADELRGGSGRVLKVSNAYGETFAMKMMLEATSDDPLERQRKQRVWQRAFMEEYRAHSSVSGVPGIPVLYGSGSYEGVPAVLMEWIDGQTLKTLKDLMPRATMRQGYPGNMVAAIGLAVGRILLEARGRSAGFVHRDISLGNIMLRGDRTNIARQMTMLDFDVCLIDMGSSFIPYAGSTSLTYRDDIWRFGTPEYAAPEMLTRDIDGIIEKRSSPSVDVYALCSVLYELYAGHTPFDVATNQHRLGVSPYIMKTQYRPVPLQPKVPADALLVKLIMGGIVAQQDQRIRLEVLFDNLQRYLGRRGMQAEGVRRSGSILPPLTSCELTMRAPFEGGCSIDDPLPEELTRYMSEREPWFRGGLRG